MAFEEAPVNGNGLSLGDLRVRSSTLVRSGWATWAVAYHMYENTMSDGKLKWVAPPRDSPSQRPASNDDFRWLRDDDASFPPTMTVTPRSNMRSR